MNLVGEAFMKAISEGLTRTSITRCSEWAEEYRVMGQPYPGKWTFKYHPWLLEMHDAEEDHIVGQKAAQLGYTELAMNYTFFNIDINRLSTLYILPSADDASDFSSSRFDPALLLSDHLALLFSKTNNVGLKRAGEVCLYVRGSRSKSKLKSIPVSLIVLDERDEMVEENIALATERQSGQLIKKLLEISTPTIQGKGVNKNFSISSEDHYMFKCPCCGRHTELVYPDCLKITGETLIDPNLKKSHLICKECEGTLHHKNKVDFLAHRLRGGKAEFVKSHSDRDIRGFYVNQLYSTTVTPYDLAKATIKARTSLTDEQELWNSKIGVPHVVKGGRVNDKDILECQSKKIYHKQKSSRGRLTTIGIDVGSVLHVVVKDWVIPSYRPPGVSINDVATPAIVYEGTTSGAIDDFDEAYQIFMDFGCRFGVVDAEPERRAAYQFANRIKGHIYLCDYQRAQAGKQITLAEDEMTIKVNRTAWLDMAIGRYSKNNILLPQDLSTEFINNIKALVRCYKRDKDGNEFGVYENVSPDHFGHAATYAEIALPFAATLSRNKNVRDVF